ncbi:hypothetical protein KKG81_04855 [bacterium]|nr:hypothetical protein [bacterium]
MTRYVFVGAGVSNIFCILEMLDKGIEGEYIVIEQGKDPYMRNKSDIMRGFLGAGLFSDGKIVYNPDRGGELKYYVGNKEAEKYIKRVMNTLKKYDNQNTNLFTSKIPTKLLEEIKENNLNYIESPIQHLGTDNLIKVGQKIYDILISKGVIFYFNIKVKQISFKQKYIGGVFGKIEYDELILGMGKSGMDFLNQIIKKYKIPTKPKAIQIGVRFESDYKYFEKIAKCSYDFKIEKNGTVDGRRYSVRTFCVNNERAYVVVENNKGLYSYNGHAYKSDSMYNGLTNFGIIMEIEGVKDPLKYTQDFVKRYNKNKTGYCYGNMDRKLTTTANEMTERTSTMDDFKIFLTIFDFIIHLDKIFGFGGDYVLYIPEVKYLTNMIELDKKSMSLKQYKNVHIIGDNAGARGIFCSIAHGLHLADWFEDI